MDLFESVVDGAIDRFHGDLHPGSRHWLRQADDVPVAVSLRFVDVDIFYKLSSPSLEAPLSETSQSWCPERLACLPPQDCVVVGSDQDLCSYFGPLRIEQPHLQLDNLDRPGKGGENPGSDTFAPARPSTSLLADLQLVVKRLVVQVVR